MEVVGGLGEGTVHSALCSSQCTASDTWYLWIVFCFLSLGGAVVNAIFFLLFKNNKKYF